MFWNPGVLRLGEGDVRPQREVVLVQLVIDFVFPASAGSTLGGADFVQESSASS